MSNMRIWEAVAKTDPAHTKPVEFGRKFTSIDAHWQIQQATKQFGPVGEGWGYNVDHSTIAITPTLMLATADVTIWWGANRLCVYGPIRATCEMYGPKTYKGKVIPGEFVCDEDAPKKALTDALTKGLSHLGFSADVFLGMFDDNRYVQRMRQEFAAKVDPVDQHLVVNGDSRSTYQQRTAEKGPGRLAAELWASQAVGLFKMPDYNLLHFREWRETAATPGGRKSNGEKLEELREKHPDLAQAIDDVVADLEPAVLGAA